jgi:hypothetical protein
MNTICIKNDSNNATGDFVPRIKAVIGSLSDNTVIRFEKGIYHFYPDNAFSAFYYVSNNDGGEKRIAFYLKNKNNIVIDGQGSVFILHGRITGFVIDGCVNIKLRAFTVTYHEDFYIQALIAEVRDGGYVLLPQNGLRCGFEDGVFTFGGENWETRLNERICLLQEFDTRLKRVAFKAPGALAKFGKVKDAASGDIPLPVAELSLTENPGGGAVLSGMPDGFYREGNTLVISLETRGNYVIFGNCSQGLVFENIKIHRSPGMGVICQVCDDITLRGVSVCLEEGSRSMVSTAADATHFVNCGGKIKIYGCVFENMLDDASNIHGIYTVVAQKTGARSAVAGLMHFQQRGVNIYKPGDKVNFYKRGTNAKKGGAVVKKSELIAPDRVALEFFEDINFAGPGDTVENAERMPEVYIKNCRTGNNRPRGFLIGTNKKAVIENNEFYNCDCGVGVYGDTAYWFESGGVSDLTVRGNVFRDCNYQAGQACIIVQPDVAQEAADHCYHKNIRVFDNLFYSFTGGAFKGKNIDGFQYFNNKFILTDTYKRGLRVKEVEIESCINAKIGKGGCYAGD